MRAISAFSRDAGMSTRVCFAVTALRIRASMSAIGSVISLSLQRIGDSVSSRFGECNSPTHQFVNSPTTLRHTRDVALERQLAEAQAAQRELSHIGAGAPALTAAVPQADLEFRRLLFFRD